MKKEHFNGTLKSAIAGCPNGQCSSGFYYENGIGTNKNETKAFE